MGSRPRKNPSDLSVDGNKATSSSDNSPSCQVPVPTISTSTSRVLEARFESAKSRPVR